MKKNYIKSILVLAIMSISFFSVKVKADMTCNYTMNTNGLNGCSVTKDFTIKFDSSGNATINKDALKDEMASTCSQYLLDKAKNADRAKSYYSKYKTCPNVYLDADSGSIEFVIADDSMALPKISAAATLTGSSGGDSGNSGGNSGGGSSSSSNNNKVLCTYTKKMRNESWNVSIKFKKVNGINKIEVGRVGQASSEATVGSPVGIDGYTFSLDTSLESQIYNKKDSDSCPKIYLSLAENSSTTITLTDKQPDASLDGSYNVSESPTQKYSDYVEGDDPVEKTQDIKDIGNVGDDVCSQSEVKRVLKFFGILILLLKFAVPMIIIVKGTFLFYNAVVKGEAADLSKSAKEFGIKIFIGLLIFFIPSLLNGVLGLYNGWAAVKSEYTDCATCLLDPTNCQP